MAHVGQRDEFPGGGAGRVRVLRISGRRGDVVRANGRWAQRLVARTLLSVLQSVAVEARYEVLIKPSSVIMRTQPRSEYRMYILLLPGRQQAGGEVSGISPSPFQTSAGRSPACCPDVVNMNNYCEGRIVLPTI